MKQLLVALLFLAGLAATLALPGRFAPLPGPSAEEAAFAALVTGAAGAALAPAEHDARVATLRALGPSALARFLEQAVARSAGELPRRVALECLAGCATAREVGALVRLASGAQAEPSTTLGPALRAAVRATLERDARAFGELVPAWRGAREALRPELLAAVAERRDPAGLEFLAWLATFEGEEWHRAVAEATLRITPAAPSAPARAHLETLCVLLRSPDAVCVQALSAALTRGRVEAALPAWIELLASPSRGTRERARRSLEEVTGLALGPEAGRWQVWHEAEIAWLDEEAAGLLAELESEDDARVLAALRALSLRRLARDELAQAVEPLLRHPTPAVRLCACAALETLASVSVLPGLVAALEDEDEAVARGAWATLRALTGLELPLDPGRWGERLALP